MHAHTVASDLQMFSKLLILRRATAVHRSVRLVSSINTVKPAALTAISRLGVRRVNARALSTTDFKHNALTTTAGVTGPLVLKERLRVERSHPKAPYVPCMAFQTIANTVTAPDAIVPKNTSAAGIHRKINQRSEETHHYEHRFEPSDHAAYVADGIGKAMLLIPIGIVVAAFGVVFLYFIFWLVVTIVVIALSILGIRVDIKHNPFIRLG